MPRKSRNELIRAQAQSTNRRKHAGVPPMRNGKPGWKPTVQLSYAKLAEKR